MGGPSSSPNSFDMARTITDQQLRIAKELDTLHFQGRSSPEVLAAIIQALARNYATVVDNK